MIRQLPPSVRSQIRSGIAITSVTQCVEELLLNAVDANSRCIAVRIDLSCFRIQVVDNGTGITADQLDKIGQRYSTSKCHTVEDLESLGQFGYRGEALASIRDISYILEIKSRARCCAQTYCKIFQQGKSLDTVESNAHRPSPGTTITVHNLFYNLPVRQKSISRTLEMENICHHVEALALMQPTLSITLRNDTTGFVLIQTHKTNSPLVTFSYLFKHSKAQSLVSVSNSFGHFCIKGYIGKESHYQKDLQFIYVNKRLVLKTQLHKLVNRVLKKSLIVRQHQALYIGEKLSPSKQADKYPVFVLNIQCPMNAYDITFDPKKTMVEFEDWDTLSAGLEEMCKEFLHKENLLTVDCLFSEKKNENNQKVNHENTNELLISNSEQTVLDKIDDEMFSNIQTRCLKSGVIKRLFEKNPFPENLDSEQHTANKQYKTENISVEKETIVSSDDINFQNISVPSSVSASGFSDSQPGKMKLSASHENVSDISNSLSHQNFTLENISESEKIPFQELETYVSTQVMGACSSNCETNFLEESTDLPKKDSFGSNYINEKLNQGKHKQMLVADNEKKGWHQKYKRNSKEIAPVKISQSTRSILNHFRAPHHKRKTAGSAVQRIKPDIKTLHCLKKRCYINEDLEKSAVKSVDSEDIFSKDQQIPLRRHQSQGIIHPHCKSLSVQDSEMLVKLSDKKSSKNSIASKLSNLYKNNGMKCCKPSKTEMSLTTKSAVPNGKCKPDEENQKDSSQSHLENQKMKQDLSSLNPNMEMCYDSRETEVQEEFTSLQEYSDDIVKSVQSFELVNPLLNFGSVLNKNTNSEALVCRKNLESPEKLVKNKRQFLCSSAFLKNLDKMKPQNTKRETSQEKESNEKHFKAFDSGHVECFSGDWHDNYNHFSNSHQIHGNLPTCSNMLCSKDKTERDCCYNLSKSSLLFRNKPSYNQCYSDKGKQLSSNEVFTESLQLAPSFPTNISVEKPILSLDFNSDSESLQDNTGSKINLELDILNNNFNEGTQVCKLKQSNDTSLTTTEKCSLAETQENVTESEDNILKKRHQIIPSPVSYINFDKEKMVTEEECVFGNPGIVFNVSDEAIGKKYSTSLIQPTPSFTYEKETCSQSTEEQRPNQKSSDICEYLNEAPKILSDTSIMHTKNPETSSKSFRTLAETSEVSRSCPQMSYMTYEILSDTSEKLEEICQTSNEIYRNEITNLAPEKLNEIPGVLSDTCKTMSDVFEVSDDFKSPVYTPVTSNNAHEIIYNTSETRNIPNFHLPNSQYNQCNTTSFRRTPDQSALVPNISFLSNEKPNVKVGFTVNRNSSTTSSTLISTKSLPPLLLDVSSYKTNPQWDDTSVSIRQDFVLSKKNDFTHSMIKQDQRSSSISRDPESAVRNLIRDNHGNELKSNKCSQQFEPECTYETSSQDQIMKIQKFGEDSRSSLTHSETEIPPFSHSFSKEVDISENGEKSSEISNLTKKNSLDSESLQPLVISESSAFSKSEKLSNDLTSSHAYVGVCIDSYNIQFMKNVDHLQNSEAMLLQDVVLAKKMPFQLDTSTISDVDLNKGQQSDKNLFGFNFKASEDLEMESTQNDYVKNESYLQKLDVGCDSEDEKESEQKITDENETDLTLKLWRNWKNPVFQIRETDVLDMWTNHSVQRKLHRITRSCQFTKAMLSQMETIGQVDNKFIACIVKSQDQKSVPDQLLMIDQHAAHERVRLEQLTADMYQLENSEENEKLTVKFSEIFPPWTLSLSEKEMRIVSSFLDEFSKIGLQLKIQQENNIIEILTAPSCIMAREASERRYNRNTVAFDLVQALIKEKIELLHDTRGAHSILPKTIHNLLCSQACHGAIKFGDPLTLVECQNLLKMLLKCKLPFQCAHGRPSLVPLLNLQHLWILTKRDPPKINLKKLQRQIEEQEKMVTFG